MTVTSSSAAKAVLDVQGWRLTTRDELLAIVKEFQAPKSRKAKGRTGSAIAIRTHVTTLDMYSYLIARFGKPNGMQSMLRGDHSDNIMHWDWYLKAGDTTVYIMGMSREIHIQVATVITDEEWITLIKAIKSDFGRLGREKGEVAKALEKWIVFPNKYVEIANQCEDKHDRITDQMGKFASFAPSSRSLKSKKGMWEAKSASKRAAGLFGDTLELKMLTPILAEAFINMMIFILCKPEVRKDQRLFKAFIRSEIDVKVADLFYKCQGFSRAPNSSDPEFAAFHKVMQKRNHFIHANVDVNQDAFEVVYFDGTIPVYAQSGDHISTFYANLEKQHDPETVVADYEAVHLFTAYLIECLEPGAQNQFQLMINDPYPAWNEAKGIPGKLFEDTVASAYFGVPFDDELKGSWT